MTYGRLDGAYVECFEHLHEIHEKVVGVDMTGELPEQELLFRYIRGDAKVLEFGGNIGRSSIVISKLLDNPRNHVVLESDPKIAKQLEKNKQANGCGFTIVNAALSETPIVQRGWDAASVDLGSMSTPPPDGWNYVPTITWAQLKQKHPIHFDTIVADCEGCMEKIFQSYPHILDGIRTIIIENDAQLRDARANDFISSFIARRGFRSVECRALNSDRPCFFQAWLR